jgi:hypothetical protein
MNGEAYVPCVCDKLFDADYRFQLAGWLRLR